MSDQFTAIVELSRQTPRLSNRQIAAKLGCEHSTVNAVVKQWRLYQSAKVLLTWIVNRATDGEFTEEQLTALDFLQSFVNDIEKKERGANHGV